jgi:SAM-dependent methyltransferase
LASAHLSGIIHAVRQIAGMIERSFAQNYWREQSIIRSMEQLLDPSQKMLDIGSGSCKMAKALSKRYGIGVTTVDVVDHNVTDLPLELYDGRHLPYDDRYFDTVMLAFVLHHAANPADLIREAVRVSRSRVLVIEDAPEGWLQKVLWRSWDYVLNHGVHSDIHIAHGAKSVTEWHDFLTTPDWSVRIVRSFRTAFPVLWTIRHVLFELKVHAGGPVTDLR